MTMDYNSNSNQRVKARLVDREVYSCVSGLFERCVEKGVIDFDEIENAYEYVCPQCGHGEQDARKFDRTGEDEYAYKCPSCEKTFEDEPELQDKEVFEYWLVTEYFYEKLKALGEPVYSYDDFNFFWGRTCTGQAILLDGTISRIANDMEILEGQANHRAWI